MSQALAASAIPKELLPGIAGGMSMMAGMAVVGGLAGVALTSNRGRGWLYGGVSTGVLLGGTIGYFGGRFIMKRAIEKLQAQAQAEQDKIQADGPTA